MHQAPSETLILASGSPRRRQLLSDAGFAFEVCVPREEAENEFHAEGGAENLVAGLAQRKAVDVADQLHKAGRHDGILIACDTAVEFRGQILGKPVDEGDARRMLTLLAGQLHCVHTGVCLMDLSGRREPLVRVATTRLRMDPLDAAQIEEYLASGAWAGKAGAFGYQDRTGWLHILEGSASNVVGLPLELLADMLAQFAAPR